jgi:TolA-binding protein
MEEALGRVRGRPGAAAALEWVPDRLAWAYVAAGQFAKAEVLFREGVERARTKFGANDPRTAEKMAWLGAHLIRREKGAEAEPVLRECLAIRERKQPDDWSRFNAESLLGGSLLGQEKYAEAEPLLLSGYKGMKGRETKVPAPARPRLAESGERVVRLYEAWGQPEKAKEWRAKLEPGTGGGEPGK